MRVLIISADNFEDSELLVPFYRFQEEGMQVDVASHKIGPIKGKHGYEVTANRVLSDTNADHYDVLCLPGGKAPESVRRDAAAQAICRHFFERNKPVAAICHGPQTLISAGLLKDRRATCYETVAEEMRNAGARYEDSEVVVDGNLITSRHPGDLPAFMRETMKLVKQG